MEDEPVMRIDLDGQIFDIGQDIIDKYPECVLAKSMMVSDGKEMEPIEIDRDGKYFSKIIEYCRGNRRAINLSRMSRIEIKKLVNDLNFFGIADDLVKQCEHELSVKNQQCIETATREEEFKELIAGETRMIIVLNLQLLVSNSIDEPGNDFERALKLVDRDKCLVVGYTGKLVGFTYPNSTEEEVPDHSLNYKVILCDPVTHKILLYDSGLAPVKDFLQVVYHANTLCSHTLHVKKFSSDLVKKEEQEKDIGTYYPYIDCLEIL